MRNRIGFSIILCSILFAVTFKNVGWNWMIGDISFSWQHFFMLAGIVGAVIAILPEKK